MVERQEHDYYPTPEYITRILLNEEKFKGNIWECACGGGAIVDVLEDNNYKEILASDKYEYNSEHLTIDFLNPSEPFYPSYVDNIITNPPYELSFEFIELALYMAQKKVALLLPIRYLTGKKRTAFYYKHPLAKVIVIPNKVDFLDEGNPMMEFGWFIWDKDYIGETILKFAEFHGTEKDLFDI